MLRRPIGVAPGSHDALCIHATSVSASAPTPRSHILARDDRLDDDTGQPVAESLPQRAEPAPDLVRAMQINQQGAGATRAHQAGHVRPERDRAPARSASASAAAPPDPEQHQRADDLFLQHADRDLDAAVASPPRHERPRRLLIQISPAPGPSTYICSGSSPGCHADSVAGTIGTCALGVHRTAPGGYRLSEGGAFDICCGSDVWEAKHAEGVAQAEEGGDGGNE